MTGAGDRESSVFEILIFVKRPNLNYRRVVARTITRIYLYISVAHHIAVLTGRSPALNLAQGMQPPVQVTGTSDEAYEDLTRGYVDGYNKFF